MPGGALADHELLEGVSQPASPVRTQVRTGSSLIGSTCDAHADRLVQARERRGRR